MCELLNTQFPLFASCQEDSDPLEHMNLAIQSSIACSDKHWLSSVLRGKTAEMLKDPCSSPPTKKNNNPKY